MLWWSIGLILVFFILRLGWRAYTHPSHVLGRQAANMNWVAVGRVSDSDGYKNVKLARNKMEAIISFQNGNVVLVRPRRETPFRDFIELERWLASNDEQPESKNDVVHICLEELSRIREEAGGLFFDEIETSVAELIADKEKTSISINEDDLSPRTLVFLLITNVIQSILPLGKYHIYRGILSMRGDDLLRLWDYSTKQLTELGYYTSEQSEEDRKWMRDQVKKAG